MLFLLSLIPSLFLDTFAGDKSDTEGEDYTGDGLANEYTGGAGDDNILGGFGNDTLAGGAGDDLIQGQGGEDVLIGNEGNDVMQGRGNDDTVQGFSGNDWVDGNDGDDFVRGGAGNDVVIGGEGSDDIFGRNGSDVLIAGTIPGAPLSNAEMDQIRDRDVDMDFFDDNAVLSDDNTADSLDGGAGDDLLLFGAGDSATGGTGSDIFALFGNGSDLDVGLSVVQDYDETQDELVVYFPDEDAADDAEVTVTTDGSDAIVNINGEEYTRILGAAGKVTADDIFVSTPEEEPIPGTPGPDKIDAGAGDDSVDALAGQDDVLGGSGDDTLNGGADEDVMQGQAGFDELNGGGASDYLQGRGGDDTVSGNEGDDWIDGNDASDVVNGGLDDDTVIGGLGADSVTGGEGKDILVAGELLADPLSTEQLSALRSGQSLSDATGIVLGERVFIADDGAADTLSGGADADYLIFGAGDTASGDAGSDTFAVLGNSSGNGLGEALITDYVPEEDALRILLDGPDESAAEPVVTVADDGPDAVISIDGQVLARVAGAAGTVSASDVQLQFGIGTHVLDPGTSPT